MGVRVRYHRGAWWVFWDDRKLKSAARKRRSKRVGDKATALVVARRIREALILGSLNLPTESETFKTYATRWLADGADNRKASTQRFYTFNLELHLEPLLGAVPIAEVTRAHCRKVIAECRKKGLRLASLYGVQRTLSAILSQAVEDAHLTANPGLRMGKYLRSADEVRPVINPLTPAEAHHFLTVIDTHWPDYYAFFLMALRSGLRLGELLAIQWGDLDFHGRFLQVQRNLVAGKLTTPKSSKRRRVDMSAHLAGTLERRLTAAKAAALKAGTPRPAWVFTNTLGEPLDGDNVRRRVFEKALTKAKLRHIRIHDLRHTFASHLIQNGESLAYVRDQMGHSSITVTVDVYGHQLPDSNRAAMDRLDAVPSDVQMASAVKTEKSKKRGK
jgi:integrase